MHEGLPNQEPPFESDLISTEDVEAVLKSSAEEGEILDRNDVELALREADRILGDNPDMKKEELAEALTDFHQVRKAAKENVEVDERDLYVDGEDSVHNENPRTPE